MQAVTHWEAELHTLSQQVSQWVAHDDANTGVCMMQL